MIDSGLKWMEKHWDFQMEESRTSAWMLGLEDDRLADVGIALGLSDGVDGLALAL